MPVRLFTTFLALLLSLSGAFAQKGQDFPLPKRGEYPVNDFAELFSQQQKQALNRFLVAYADSTSTQIVIVTIESLNGEDPNLYAAELGQQWGVGSKEQENGLVFLIAPNDRKVALQNGYGLEQYLTDANSKLIIENHILPQFRQEDYFGGVQAGLVQIIALLEGNFEGGSPPAKGKRSLWRYLPIVLILALFYFLRRRGGGGGMGGYRGAGGVWLGGMPMGGSRGGGFGGGLGGGGGFSGGFGGGGFGGGGASGSW